MPHQCVKCATVYDSTSESLLKGCASCGGKFFFFIKKDSLKKIEEVTKNLTQEDKEKIEEDVKDIIGLKEDAPVILDLESVSVLQPGKFELDLVKLFKKDPMVYRLEEGKYVIDVASTFLNANKEDEE